MEVPLLESVCPTWAYEFGDGTALVVFDQETAGTMTLLRDPRRVHNREPVTAKAVAADDISWKPMKRRKGETGHVFQLTSDGNVTCRIEVTASICNNGNTDRLRRVAVVQPSYAPLAVASGIADRSSMLVYDDPHTHVCTLRELHASLEVDTDLGYAPVSECCVTRQFERLVPRYPHCATRAEIQEACLVWEQTRDFMKAMSVVTADCIDMYLEKEVRRTGAHELRRRATEWRSSVR